MKRTILWLTALILALALAACAAPMDEEELREYTAWKNQREAEERLRQEQSEAETPLVTEAPAAT